MTFNPNKPCQTKDGRPVRILCTDRKGSYPILALVPNKSPHHYSDSALSYDTEGVWCARNEALDLVNVPERKSTFLNLFGADYRGSGIHYPTLGKARMAAGMNHSGVVEVVFEDDKPVSVTLHPAKED